MKDEGQAVIRPRSICHIEKQTTIVLTSRDGISYAPSAHSEAMPCFGNESVSAITDDDYLRQRNT